MLIYELIVNYEERSRGTIVIVACIVYIVILNDSCLLYRGSACVVLIG
jgi:hypothetical protein